MPDPLPIELQPCNWHELEREDARKIWEHYEQFLLEKGYHLMGSTIYDTIGGDVTDIPPPAADPFRPKDTEQFIHRNNNPKSLLFTRTHSYWQPVRIVLCSICQVSSKIVYIVRRNLLWHR